jgi:hypothetical protein
LPTSCFQFPFIWSLFIIGLHEVGPTMRTWSPGPGTPLRCEGGGLAREFGTPRGRGVIGHALALFGALLAHFGRVSGGFPRPPESRTTEPPGPCRRERRLGLSGSPRISGKYLISPQKSAIYPSQGPATDLGPIPFGGGSPRPPVSARAGGGPGKGALGLGMRRAWAAGGDRAAMPAVRFVRVTG